MAASNNELITLNVGGKLFRTTRATLTKHPDSMLAAMFRGDMQASGLRDEQGHPFLDRDPTHFPFILAYLRDGRVPPLPQGLLELQQLRVEAEFFAMVELAEAAGAAAANIATAASNAAVAAAEERLHAASRRVVEQKRAEAVQTADDAVAAVQDALEEAEAHPLLPLLPAAEAELQAMHAHWEAMRELRPGEEVPADAWQEAQDDVAAAEQALDQVRAAVAAETAAAKRLREALLARLCALGADLPAAEAQLRATHPDLANRKFD